MNGDEDTFTCYFCEKPIDSPGSLPGAMVFHPQCFDETEILRARIAALESQLAEAGAREVIKDNALHVAVNLLNSKYINSTFEWAYIHGYAATADDLAMVKASWEVIETATSAPPSPAAAELEALRKLEAAVIDHRDGKGDSLLGLREAVANALAAVTAARGVKP